MKCRNWKIDLRVTVVATLLVAGLTACGGGGGSNSTGASSTNAALGQNSASEPNEVTTRTLPAVPATGQTITFMHYNDLHAHLNPHIDRVSDGQGGTRIEERGGVARAATLIQRIRKDNPDSILMNIGDTYHGGAEAWFTLGNAIVDPVNALGIDVGVPGNWDFGFSSTVFRLRYTDEPFAGIIGITDQLKPTFKDIKRPNFPNLAANMSATLSGASVLPATMTMDINGTRVGLIGLTSDIVKFVYPLLAPAFSFTGEGLDAENAELAYRDLVNRHAKELRATGADIVVVMSELGIHKDARIADLIDSESVDVFFSAHTHEATFEPLTSDSGALVVEAGNDGYLGRMDITVEDGKVSARNWELLAIDASLPADPQVQALVDKARAPFMAVDVHFDDPMPNSALAFIKPLDSVIGHVDMPLDRRDSLESTFSNAMTDILRHYSGTDLAMTPGFRFDSVIAPGAVLEDNIVLNGEVTVEDAYRFFPMMFAIATGEVDGARLREILEESLTNTYSPEVFNHRGGWLEGWSGLSMSVNLANPDGERVLDMRLKDTGQVIHDDTVVTVTGCKRPIEPRDMICRHTGFSNVRPFFSGVLATGETWTVLDFFIEAIADGVPFDSQRKDIIDINSTPRWPDAPFIQPVGGVE